MKTVKKHFRVLIAYNQPVSFDGKDELDLISEQGVVEEANAVARALTRKGHEVFLLAVSDLEYDLFDIKKFNPDVIFNLCEGYQGRAHLEMHMAALWDLLRIPYTGNRPLTLGIAQDKVLTKRLLEAYKINTPPFQVFTKVPTSTYLGFPMIAKPVREDASVGIFQNSIINSTQALKEVVSRLLEKYHQPILVEKFISGREFNVSILGNAPARVLPISEIKFPQSGIKSSPIVSYEAKWLKEHPSYRQIQAVCPADISPELQRRLEDTALLVYHLLYGRGYGRVDMRLDNQDRIYVLEFNPNPDISPDAGFVRSLSAAHIKYADFVEILIKQAMMGQNYANHSPFATN